MLKQFLQLKLSQKLSPQQIQLMKLMDTNSGTICGKAEEVAW